MSKSNVIQLHDEPGVSAKKEKAKPRNTMPDGRKRIRMDVGMDPDTKKRIRKAFYGKSLKEAKEKYLEYLKQQGMPVPQSDPEQTVAKWVDVWLDIYGQQAGSSTNTTTEINTRKLIAAIGDMKMSDVRELHLQQFANSVAHYAKSTVDKIRITTNAVFKRAIGNQIISINPCDGVKWSSVGEGTHRYLDPWEIELIGSHWHAYRAGLWAMIMLFAGLRRGEVLALRWSDIDVGKDSAVIHVRRGLHFEVNEPILGNTKTDASVRDVPIMPPLLAALESIPMPPPSEYVCIGAQGQMVTQSIWARSWDAFNRTMANALNQDTRTLVNPGRRTDKDEDRYKDTPRKTFEIRSHDLRHSFASMLYDAGVDIKTAQLLLGHADPQITMRIYTHLSEKKQSASVDKLAEYTRNLSSKFSSGAQMGLSPTDKPL